MSNQGGTQRGTESTDSPICSESVYYTLRSVAYRLREAYLSSPSLFNSTETIAWAVAHLEDLTERFEDGDQA